MCTTIFKEKEIIELCKLDAEIIKIAFEKGGGDTGKIAIHNSIESFLRFLSFRKQGAIVPSLDMDYRTYIVNLLKITLRSLDEKHKHTLFQEVVFPKNQ